MSHIFQNKTLPHISICKTFRVVGFCQYFAALDSFLVSHIQRTEKLMSCIFQNKTMPHMSICQAFRVVGFCKYFAAVNVDYPSLRNTWKYMYLLGDYSFHAIRNIGTSFSTLHNKDEWTNL